jgi:hypothetical protein
LKVVGRCGSHLPPDKADAARKVVAMIKTIRFVAAALIAVLILVSTMPAHAETVVVKYRGPVDLGRMTCESITRSSFINRLCYDDKETYVVVQLDATYYHYCGVPADVVANWRAAESMGRFYNAQIKGRFDCRQGHVPAY